MVLACLDCDVVFEGNNARGFTCPNCGGKDSDEVYPEELTSEQKEATQRYVFDMADHETVDHAVEAHSTSLMRALAGAGADAGLLQMLESSFQSVLSSIACAVYARSLGIDPWAFAFEGEERVRIMEDLAQDFSDKGYDVEFAWGEDSPYAKGKAVPKRKIVRTELEGFREDHQPQPMHEALADHICAGGAKLLEIIAAHPDAVPPEGRRTVAKLLHELLTGRDQILLALDGDTYRVLADVLEEFQVPHYRDVQEVEGHQVRYIIPEEDGEYLERIRQQIFRPSRN